ncbi:U1 zinc finger domain-containing protein [Trichoderma sp. SZMC 28015]
MPKFFCDYCDVYLTHDSMSVRKAHNSGRNHLRNVVDYYQQIGHEKAQSVIDSITSSYAAEGQAHANPMLLQNQPGQGFPAFGFPGGIPPPFPGMPGAPPGQFPQGLPRTSSSSSSSSSSPLLLSRIF